jgi:predicted GNAT family acetyltransferase
VAGAVERKPFARNVESIWVAPTHRRQGVLRALLQALAGREQQTEQTEVTELLLWVLDGNYLARCAYKALGFKSTGESTSGVM